MCEYEELMRVGAFYKASDSNYLWVLSVRRNAMETWISLEVFWAMGYVKLKCSAHSFKG